MRELTKTLSRMRRNPKGIRFAELRRVCEHYFGKPRQGGSHCIFKAPWSGNPRINIQDRKGWAKPYQVKQVLKAIEKIEAKSDF